VGCLLLDGRGRLTSITHRRKAIELIGDAQAACESLLSAFSEIGICRLKIKRFCKAFLGGAGATIAANAVNAWFPTS
jgi:hypothetical protein